MIADAERGSPSASQNPLLDLNPDSESERAMERSPAPAMIRLSVGDEQAAPGPLRPPIQGGPIIDDSVWIASFLALLKR